MTKKQEVASLRKQIREVEQKMTAIENQLDTERLPRDRPGRGGRSYCRGGGRWRWRRV